MKPNLLSQMLRNAILLLLFFGLGTSSLVANSAVADSGLDYGVGNPTILHEVSTEWEEVSSTKAGQKFGIEDLYSISKTNKPVAGNRFPSLPQDFKPFVLDRSFEELLFGALHKFKPNQNELSQIIGKVSDLGPSKMPDLLADLKFIDAQGNAIGDDLLEFLLSADDIAGFGRRVKAWDALLDYPVFRKNIDYLDYTDDYLTRTGKTKQQFLDDLDDFEDPKKIFLDELDDTPASGTYANNPSGVWNENPFLRGREIEDALGQNLHDNFPYIDKFDDVANSVTSIKSTDTYAKTY